MRPGRRDFLAGVSLGLLALGDPSGFRRLLRFRPAANPFSLGVASGDPDARGVVLWTRLAPDPLAGGGMPPDPVEVRWEVADDEAFGRIVRRGAAVAHPQLGHSVHVEVDGLRPDRWYWYRFIAGGETSPVGRTRTLPPPGALPDPFRFVFISCQHYEHGLFTAFSHLVDETPALVIHLGDYIYEDAAGDGTVRSHGTGEILTLEDYRARYALYKLDPLLQAAHHAAPWVVTWDDHEVDNNYVSGFPEQGEPGPAFLARRAAAYQAFYEHQPVRIGARPRGPDARLYRAIDVGALARFFVLDTRQYRSDQPCGDRRQPPCPGIFDPAATVLGTDQERWLFDGMRRSTVPWTVLAQQVFFAKFDALPGEGEILNMDSWNGYQVARRRVLDAMAARGRRNTVVLTGDVHSNWASELRQDFSAPETPVVGTEFICTSITSGGDGADTYPWAASGLRENPHIRFTNSQRGYVRCDIGPRLWRTDYRVIPFVSRPGAPVSTRRSFVLEAGRPELQDG